MGRLERHMKPVQAKGVVHHLVAETAKGMAEATYQECALNDAWYAANPKVEVFVRKRWQSFIQPAREMLAEMLHPDKHYMTTESQRQEIHEALLLNAAANPAANHLIMP